MSNESTSLLNFNAVGEKEGIRVHYSSMQHVPNGEQESGYPHLITIDWPYGEENSDSHHKGMPDAFTNEKQLVLEESLAPLQKKGMSHLMLVVTGNGSKKWFWYVNNRQGWMDAFNQLVPPNIAFPITLSAEDDPTWALYHNFMAHMKSE